MNSNEKKQLVLVLARNYSTGLSVIRSLGAAGYTVDLIAGAYKKGALDIAACSKYVNKTVEIVSKKGSSSGESKLLEVLYRYVGQYKQKPVIFPTDDYTASVVDQNRVALEKYFIMPSIAGGGEGSLTACMDKTFQMELAKQAGILTPLQWMISLNAPISIPENMVYPCFCKPIESISGYKKEMKACKDEAELREHLVNLRKNNKNRSVLVQEFLEIDAEIDLSGVCFDQEIIIPGIIRKTHVAQYEKGVTLTGKIVPFEELGDLQHKIIQMLKEFHYVGMFDMELNIVGDKVYFNEINLRSGGPNFSYFMSGVNLPALYVDGVTAQSRTLEQQRISEFNKTFVYEKVAWEDYIHGFMTRKEVKDCIKNADITLLYNAEDPAPGQLFEKIIRLAILKSKVKKVVRIYKSGVKKIKHGLKWRISRLKNRVLGYPQTKKINDRNPASETPRVIVAGRNYCSNLCMARAIGQAGYEVEVVRIFQTKPKNPFKQYLAPDAYSKYVKAFHVCITNRNEKRLIKCLERIADSDKKMLLIPADDLVAEVIDRYLDELKEYYLLPNILHKPGEISWLMNKDVQKKLAREACLPVVNSCTIKVKEGKHHKARIPDGVSYPCFIKPTISKNSSKSRLKVCYNKNDLQKSLNEFSKNKTIEMLVEDYVVIRKEYALLGLSTKDGVVIPGFFVTVKGGHEGRKGVTMMGRVLPCSKEQKLIDDIKAFVESLHFEGLFDVDLIETVDGDLYFVELNLRFGASGYAITQSGVNLPGMYADYMLKNIPIELESCVKETGKTFVSEKLLLEEYESKYLSKADVNAYMNKADIHFIKNDNDMRPYKHFKKFYTVASLKRRLKH